MDRFRENVGLSGRGARLCSRRFLPVVFIVFLVRQDVLEKPGLPWGTAATTALPEGPGHAGIDMGGLARQSQSGLRSELSYVRDVWDVR
jgi:hypothetical protein